MVSKTNITGIILAGGKSARMGSEKGFALYKNKPFIKHIIDVIQPLVSEIIIVSNNPDYDRFNLKRVNDIIENTGPLAGLYSGLYHSTTENNLVLSCDVPLVNDELLSTLFSEASNEHEIVQISSQGKTMPLIALYKKSCMDPCLETLESGERRLRVFVSQLKTKTISIDGSLEKYVQNINTLDELKRLQDDADQDLF